MASIATVNQLIDYYANLLIVQYHDKPKAKATIELLVRSMIANVVIFDVRDGYDIETAVGVQLDVLGKYIGADRTYTEENFEDTFSFIAYDEVDAVPADRVGFADYVDFETIDGSWLTYDSVLTNRLQLIDEDYRTLLKLKIAQNNINHSHGSIDAAIFEFFNTAVYASSANDMTMVYFVPFELTAIIRAAQQKGILPKPIGVSLQYLIPQNENYFGFAEYFATSPRIEGFTTYAEYDSKNGDSLNYNDLTA